MRLHLFLCSSATEKVVLCSRQYARSGLYAVGVLVAWSMSDIWEKACGDFGLCWLMFPNENQIFKSDIHVLPLIGSAAPRPILLFPICPVVMPTVRLLDDAGNQNQEYELLSNFHTRLSAYTNTHCCALLSFSHSCQWVMSRNNATTRNSGNLNELSVWNHRIILENVGRYFAAFWFTCSLSSDYYNLTFGQIKSNTHTHTLQPHTHSHSNFEMFAFWFEKISDSLFQTLFPHLKAK